jgi:hypothetical protein
MKNILKNILSLPIIFIMFYLLYFVCDIVFGAIYHYIPYFLIAIIPTLILWFVFQYLISQYILLKFISNGIYYLISHFLIIAYVTIIKCYSCLWYLQNRKAPLISINLQKTILIEELTLGIIAFFIIIYIWKRFYKQQIL